MTADVVVSWAGASSASRSPTCSRAKASPRRCSTPARSGGRRRGPAAGLCFPGGDRPIPLAVAQLRGLSGPVSTPNGPRAREETGIDNGYLRCGGVDVALTETDEHDLASSAGRWRDEGIAFEQLSRRVDLARRRAGPSARPSGSAGYFLPGHGLNPQPVASSALGVATADGGRDGARGPSGRRIPTPRGPRRERFHTGWADPLRRFAS